MARADLGHPPERALEPIEPKVVREPKWPPRAAFRPEQEGPLESSHAKNFSWYLKIKLSEAQTFWRQWGYPAKLEGRHGGTYYSFFPPVSQSVMRSSMSVPRDWNSMENTTAVTYPAGTTVYIGPAAAQAGYPGGGIQVFVPNSQ